MRAVLDAPVVVGHQHKTKYTDQVVCGVLFVSSRDYVVYDADERPGSLSALTLDKWRLRGRSHVYNDPTEISSSCCFDHRCIVFCAIMAGVKQRRRVAGIQQQLAA